MRLTPAILLFSCLTAFATGNGQTVSLHLTNAPVKQVLKEIIKQTRVTILYDEETMQQAKPVNINVKNASLKDVLDLCFKKQDLTYVISGKIITITRKKNESPVNEEIVNSTNALNIHGKVVDENGKPVPGVTVTVKGTKKQTITDENGEFTLSNVETNAVLAFSSVNMEHFEIHVGGQTEILAKLKTKTSELDEVQIIAYGQTTKRLQTGNVSSLKAEDIQKQPVQNPLLALEGRVPGLFINQTSGVPGGGVQVRIQGQNSLTQGNDPLYVIDGVPYTSQLLPNISSYGTGIMGSSGGTSINGYASGDGNPLAFLSPSDIESITVLKDADATAIYGSRAANGAILITTKRGKIGSSQIDINLQTGWGKVTKMMPLLNTEQYLQMRHEAIQNDSVNIQTGDYDINGVWDSTRYTDWQKVLIGNTAQYTDINGGISGGNANSQYLVGGNYHRETTVFPGDLSDQKGSLHFNLNSNTSNQKFRFQLSGNYLVDNNRLIESDLTYISLILAPDAPPLYKSDGTLNWAPNAGGSSTWNNPLSYLYNKYTIRTNNLISRALLEYQIFPKLKISSSFGYTDLEVNETDLRPLLSTAPENRPYSARAAIYGNSSIRSWIIEPQLNYQKFFGKSKANLLIGTTILQNHSNDKQIYGIGFNNDQVLEDIASAPAVGVLYTQSSTYKYNALFGRLVYSYNDKYLVNFSARRDGSSRFGSENQFNNFAAIGGGWVFSKESLFKNQLSFISFGKLRGSYGMTGNDQIGDYKFLNLYNPISVGVAYQGATGIGIAGLPNPHLKWEETKKSQFGLDLGILQDRILLTVNYFNNRSSNQLLSYALPNLTGFGNIIDNFPATVRNYGLEFVVNIAAVKSKYFSWTSNINLTLPKNKLVAFPNISASSYASTYIVGQPVSLAKTYHLVGVDPAIGVYQFADSTGKSTFAPDYSKDRTILQNSSPSCFGGFENSFSYKGFELDIFFQFVKQKAVSDRFGIGTGVGVFNINQPTWVLDRWQKPGDITTIQKYSSTNKYFSQLSNAESSSDAAWMDASYIRLKNLSLAWQVPNTWKHKLSLKNAQLYVHAQNLITITNYKGLDPETKSIQSLPPLKVLTIGIRIGL